MIGNQAQFHGETLGGCRETLGVCPTTSCVSRLKLLWDNNIKTLGGGWGAPRKCGASMIDTNISKGCHIKRPMSFRERESLGLAASESQSNSSCGRRQIYLLRTSSSLFFIHGRQCPCPPSQALPALLPIHTLQNL